MNTDQFANRLYRFALSVVRLSRTFQSFPDMPTIRGQLIRAVTSSASNYRASKCARSSRDWYAKICIAVEEIDESWFWLIMIVDLEYIPSQKAEIYLKEAEALTKILTKARSSAKKNGI